MTALFQPAPHRRALPARGAGRSTQNDGLNLPGRTAAIQKPNVKTPWPHSGHSWTRYGRPATERRSRPHGKPKTERRIARKWVRECAFPPLVWLVSRTFEQHAIEVDA
jgi:hypothetical protein